MKTHNNALRSCLDDYNATTHLNPADFYCPITFQFVPAEKVCKGHLIPEKLGGQDTIPQFADVDNFFGATVEASCTVFDKAQGLSEYEILADKLLAQEIRPVLHVNGQQPSYFHTDRPVEGMPTISVNFGDRECLFGAKLSLDECEELLKQGPLRIWVEAHKDFSIPFIGMLLHSAHLTMFEMLGYSYALREEAGVRFGREILGDFYAKSDGNHAEGRRLAASFFAPYDLSLIHI